RLWLSQVTTAFRRDRRPGSRREPGPARVRETLLELTIVEPAEQAEGNPMVLISAHQGGSEDARPATYEAYKAAPASGAEYAELDIRKTKGGIAVRYPEAGP